MLKKTYVDMDEVLVDFAGHFNQTIHRGGLVKNDFDDYEKQIVGYKDWWLKMPPRADAFKLIDYLTDKKHDIHILSAAPEWHPDAARQKIEWMKKHFPSIPKSKIIITRSAKKKLYASGGHILIDDFTKNIKDWNAAGGIGIHHVNTANTIKQLENK